MSAAVQTIWAELLATTLADAGVGPCVISPGSRSTPLVAALAREPRLARVTIIDERAAAFYALGAARATGVPAVLVCTSGTAAAHYLPALVEASHAGVPLIAITADRPPELHACGASQTIAQVGIYGGFVRGAFDLGAPAPGELALRAVRRTLVQAITRARGPHPGPVHVEVPLRKPLEPQPPGTPDEHALARAAAALAGPLAIAPPTLAADRDALDALARTLAAEPAGVIVAGALPAAFAADRAAVFALAARTGYPIIAEAASQLRLAPHPADVVVVEHVDLIPPAALPAARVIVQLGAEPVAASWPAWSAAATAAGAARWVLAGSAWHDPDASARVLLGDVGDAVRALGERVPARPATPGGWAARWRDLDAAAARATAAALAAHPRSEAAALRAALAALPAGARLQIGNSLPIRVVEHVAAHVGADAPARTTPIPVLAQRGAAGIDGLIASAAGATTAGAPVLLVLGDVSFAHDLGSLLVARDVAAPLAILVVDNGGGQIFAGLPVARAELGGAFDAHWLTAPAIDPAAIATAIGLRAITAADPAAVGAAVAAALATAGATVIHAPVSASGAHDVRRTAIELFTASASAGRDRRPS